MKSLELHKTCSVPEYFSLEESGDVRHEFINGNLIEISGASKMRRAIGRWFLSHKKKKLFLCQI